MANSRQILARRRAAANISKVTATMETISAVRYRQLFHQWQQGQQFYEALAQLVYLMISAEKSIAHPLLASSANKRQALIVIGSDRGLCGAYHNELFRQVEIHLKLASRFGRQLDLYAKGRKVVSYLEHRKIKPAGVYEDIDQTLSSEQSRQIADYFVKQYLAGKIGRLGIVYHRFFSAASQKVQTLTILPISELIDDLTTRSTVIWPYELLFEDFTLSPNAYELFEKLSEMIIRTAIEGCFLEAALSEHLARVVCMRNATDSAEEMIEDLTRQYNRLRQGQITVELLDIVSGVEAMK